MRHTDAVRAAFALVALLAAEPALADTVVYVVRHAEKAKDPGDGDPELVSAGRARAQALAEALRSTDIAAVFTTKYKRNRQTVAPLAAAKKLTPKVYEADGYDALVAAVKRDHRGQRVVIAGHSNTVPDILRAFGAKTKIALEHSDYDGLFVLIVGPKHTRLEHLHYGGPNP